MKINEVILDSLTAFGSAGIHSLRQSFPSCHPEKAKPPKDTCSCSDSRTTGVLPSAQDNSEFGFFRSLFRPAVPLIERFLLRWLSPARCQYEMVGARGPCHVNTKVSKREIMGLVGHSDS